MNALAGTPDIRADDGRASALPGKIFLPPRTLRALALLYALAACNCALVLASAGLSVAWSDFASVLVLVPVLLGFAAVFHRLTTFDRLAHGMAIAALAVLSLLVCGFTSNAGLRLGFPLMDEAFATADAMIGSDTGVVIRLFANGRLPVAAPHFLYENAGIVLCALLFAMVALGRLTQAWTLALTTFASMQLVALISPFAPAWGAMKRLAAQGFHGAGLPPESGTYQWPAFAHFYTGNDPVLRIDHVGGVVAFPSFHTVLGLLIVQALWDTPLRWVAVALGASVIIAAVPFGGHYTVDLIAGFAVWALCCKAASAINSPSG